MVLFQSTSEVHQTISEAVVRGVYVLDRILPGIVSAAVAPAGIPVPEIRVGFAKVGGHHASRVGVVADVQHTHFSKHWYVKWDHPEIGFTAVLSVPDFFVEDGPFELAARATRICGLDGYARSDRVKIGRAVCSLRPCGARVIEVSPGQMASPYRDPNPAVTNHLLLLASQEIPTLKNFSFSPPHGGSR